MTSKQETWNWMFEKWTRKLKITKPVNLQNGMIITNLRSMKHGGLNVLGNNIINYVKTLIVARQKLNNMEMSS